MLERLFPYEYAPSVFNINFKKLYEKGYRGLIFDIDNTLVHHGDNSNPEIDAFLQDLKTIGFKLLMLSDNDEARIKRFLANIDALYIADAKKPAKDSYEKAVSMLDLPKDKVIVIGDQIFLDILGANNAGIPNILVKFLRFENETDFGKRRRVEQRILAIYKDKSKYRHRFGKILIKTPGKKYYILHKNSSNNPDNNPVAAKETPAKEAPAKEEPSKEKKLFCEISPLTYKISEKKGICKRYAKDLIRNKHFADTRNAIALPNLVYSYHCNLIKKAPGIDPVTQENKATNIMIACSRMNGLVLNPGDEFSFWKLVGNTTKANGYKEGRIIEGNKLIVGLGGGLCNLGNAIHLLVLHSPLEVTEVHFHSDALAPDANGIRVPMSSGTSVSYNYIDFRFKNNTNQKVQLNLWVADEQLFAELRSEKPFANNYQISEEDHHFAKEGEKYYRISRIYRETVSKETGKILDKELIRDNHSEVMFDYDLIPKDQIR